MGFWINVTIGCMFTPSGARPVSTAIDLHQGWNMIGFPSFNASYTVADLKADIGLAGILVEVLDENAAYLTSRLKGCPGVVPQKLYEGTASGSFYLYAMSYKKEHFNDVDRGRFLKAVAAEGVSLSPYIERGLHREPGSITS
jgi:hypothetical protein